MKHRVKILDIKQDDMIVDRDYMKIIEVETHDGKRNIIEVEEYNASTVAEDINNSREEHVIVFGDYIYSKINIKTIKPFEEKGDK